MEPDQMCAIGGCPEWFTESDAMKEYLCASQSSPLD
jgi:hypothetical protein